MEEQKENQLEGEERRNTVKKGTIKSFIIDLTNPNETDWKKEKSPINRFIIEKTEGIRNKLGR
jgi:hypothetical protein